jgi:hypothetical protein
MAFLLVIAFVTPLHLAWTRDAGLGDIGADGPGYVMMAQHYAPFGARDAAQEAVATYSRFPPMYPMVLAFAGAANNLARAHLVNTICLLMALLALYIFQIRSGLSAARSALLVLLFGIIRGSWLLGLFIQSEYLYLFFSLLALTLMTAYRPGGRQEVLSGAALACAAAILTRSVGVSLLAPLAIALWRAPRRSAAISLLIALVPPLAWQMVHRSHLGYAEAVGSIYGSGGWHILKGQLAVELPALHKGFGENFLHDAFLSPLADALGLLCLAAAVWRAIRLKPDAVYVLANLAILLVWPYPEEARRFLWVLVPLLIAQPLFGYDEWQARGGEAAASRILAAAVAAVILTMALPAVAFIADRYRSADYCDLPGAAGFQIWYRQDPVFAARAVATQLLITNAMRGIPQSVPESDCVIATRPELLSYFGRRRSVVPPLNSVREPFFTAAIRSTGCHYVFGMMGTDSRFPAPLHPLPRLQSQIEPVFVSASAEPIDGSYPVIAALAKLH